MYIVSGCLLGRNCKYNGGNNANEDVIEFCKTHKYIEVCPESAAKLSGTLPGRFSILFSLFQKVYVLRQLECVTLSAPITRRKAVIFCAAVNDKGIASETMMHRFTPLGNVIFFNITYNV